MSTDDFLARRRKNFNVGAGCLQASNLRALERRKKTFAIKVLPVMNPDEEGEAELRITENGYQWQGIRLLRSEIAKVVAALQDFL